MPDLAKIILRNHKIDAVKRFHPWIFSGAIKEMEGEVKEGAIVEVYSDQGEYLATGLYNPSNIAVKILSFQKVSDIAQLFLEKFQNAYQLRQQIGLVDNPKTNCYRLINAEGDGLPSLIVDWYNGTAVIQAYSLALYQRLDLIVDCLKTIYADNLRAIYDKSAAGFFLDQRENRAILAQYCQNKRVLNTFSYSGGFSVYAMQAGAALVHSVDSSHGAIDLTEKNIALNNLGEVPHQSYSADVFNFLRDCQEDYDLIVLDPPAFAKSIQSRHQAVMAYKRLNYQAFQKIRPQGIIFTFSCSQVVNEEHFQGAVMAAAIESARPVRILARLSQPADHPTSIYHSEGSYLKGLVLAVD
ncbi:MAG: class I SAM-dependent rRNA methyltransferase [Microcystis aeruginosa G11-06]|nr:class I SAM-dependent rRNA methyltransferase [Microcystis aeruginosa G11-06]